MTVLATTSSLGGTWLLCDSAACLAPRGLAGPAPVASADPGRVARGAILGHYRDRHLDCEIIDTFLEQHGSSHESDTTPSRWAPALCASACSTTSAKAATSAMRVRMQGSVYGTRRCIDWVLGPSSASGLLVLRSKCWRDSMRLHLTTPAIQAPCSGIAAAQGA